MRGAAATASREKLARKPQYDRAVLALAGHGGAVLPHVVEGTRATPQVQTGREGARPRRPWRRARPRPRKSPGPGRRRWPRRGSSRCRGCCRWRCAYPAATPIRRRPCAGSRRRRPARPPRGPPLMRIAGTEGAASVKSDAFSQTATQRSAINDAAASTSSEDAMALPESTSASGMLGVITVARGNSWRTSASTAASAMSAEPTWPP